MMILSDPAITAGNKKPSVPFPVKRASGAPSFPFPVLGLPPKCGKHVGNMWLVAPSFPFPLGFPPKCRKHVGNTWLVAPSFPFPLRFPAKIGPGC